jgi:hypothetical protein
MDVAPTLEEKKGKAITHLEDTLRLLGDETTLDCQRRWHSLPHGIQIKEPHSHNTLQDSFFKTSLYKESLGKLNGKWIRLKFNPPLILHPSQLEYFDREKERDD